MLIFLSIIALSILFWIGFAPAVIIGLIVAWVFPGITVWPAVGIAVAAQIAIGVIKT